MILGIAINPYSTDVARELIAGAKKLSIQTRIIDLPSLVVSFNGGKTIVSDKDGEVKIDSLAPYLLFGFPAAVNALRALTQKVFCQNPVDNVLIADDKAATAERLSQAGIPQVPTIVCSDDFKTVQEIVGKIGYPVVIKRAYGAQGRWVRLATDKTSLKIAFEELIAEGRPTALILQPQIVETKGRAIRVIITGGKILAATERIAQKGEWRSNTANGSTQQPVDLSLNERQIVLAAVKAAGLKHAGIDLLRTSKKSLILEINSCPGFSIMLTYFKFDLTKSILKASISNA